MSVESNALSRNATPVVVAQRMADLLQCFPSAAIGGVQWHALVRKYEERHGKMPDLEVLGHSSALAAATALLWDVIRVVEAEDTDNPVVAVEDAVALTPLPGALASWPSLYQVLCEVVCKHGTIEKSDSGSKMRVLLLSQVKPLLQRYWHSDFDEGAAYFTEEGSTLKLKKMKHLLLALLRWRSQRVAWRVSMNASASDPSKRKMSASAMSSPMDAAMEMDLELVQSKTRNDFLLRCVCPEAKLSQDLLSATLTDAASNNVEPKDMSNDSLTQASPDNISTTASEPTIPCNASDYSSASEQIAQEMAQLRAENAKLKEENTLLENRGFQNAVLRAELFQTPSKPRPALELPELFDDPFEPPPQICSWASSPMGSMSSGITGFGSGSLTPFSESSASCNASGYATPVPPAVAQSQVTFVPVWFPMGDLSSIPSGVVQQARTMFVANDPDTGDGRPQPQTTGFVQQARAMFEKHAVIPSFFAENSTQQ